jgi:hypothetical protein
VNPGEHILHMVEGPVVTAADPIDAESRTADLAGRGVPRQAATGPADPLFPGPGLRGWGSAAGFVLGRCARPLVPIALLIALPMHFFVGRVDDTVVVAPALSDLAGGFGLLLLPLMWLAYFTASALPQVIGVAGVVAVALPTAATGRPPRTRAIWRLVAYRLRPLWLWFALFGVVSEVLPSVLTADRLDPAVAVPLAAGLGLVATAVFTFTGMLGCVVLIERGHGPRRALHLLGRAPAGPLVVTALTMVGLPRLGEIAGGDLGATVAAVGALLLWAIAALLTYARARAAEGPVTSGSLYRELVVPDAD